MTPFASAFLVFLFFFLFFQAMNYLLARRRVVKFYIIKSGSINNQSLCIIETDNPIKAI